MNKSWKNNNYLLKEYKESGADETRYYFVLDYSKYELSKLDDISSYNNNYYTIEDPGMDSWGPYVCTFLKCDTIYEYCNDDGGYEYTIGYFENKKFIQCIRFNMDGIKRIVKDSELDN